MPLSEPLQPAQEVSIRAARADAEDASRFCGLFNATYARKVARGYYDWQFFRTPFPCRLLFATTADGDFAGCYGCQLKPSLDGATRLAWTLDMMVAPAWQRKGVFKAMARSAEEWASSQSVAALCVMANAQGQAALVGGMKWRPVTTFTDFVCQSPEVVQPEREVEQAGLLLSKIDRFDDALLEPTHTVGQGSARTFRSADYMNWRFVEHAQHRYDLLALQVRGEDQGYVALKVFTDPHTGHRFGDIVDIGWARSLDGSLPMILRRVLEHFQDMGVRTASTWLQTNTPLDPAGAAAGFVPTERKRYFCCKAIDSKNRWLEDVSRWSITMTEAEVY
jgi:GNAT superfamily N-acetyltransferase